MTTPFGRAQALGSLAALAAAFTAFTACGGSEPTPAAPPPKPTTVAKPTATPTETAAPVDTPPSDPAQGACPPGMVAIEGGTLRQGSPKGQGRPDEQPQSEVKIEAFCIDATEVNLKTYKACVANDICDAPPESIQTEEKLSAATVEQRSTLCTARFAKNLEEKQDLPVNCVSHDDAERFCKWKGQRLPTEAEMEWLATGGEDRLEFPWGNKAPNANNACWNKADGPCPVKSLPPQVSGVYDVVGNLSEWTSTSYAAYGKADSGGEDYSVRGGSWKSKKPEELRGKRRESRPPIYREVDVGFRCATKSRAH
ncbi:MAG: formylglycine-generating enzyme family protein [Polyangiaceae bacterium]